ncbi:hypothetical protein Z517_02994 [Fonsecaea pedrosoi CBS 271.37]|uniref:Uncharacterized protein n=1 Tax=Fonsecaea pedrosoi CBS 271.37 TaxID=1442368 RepID=A0A0D2GRY5_9EURO|nr:uncharacterized protein Z517_02994 [Fonsecaea pedrosoi CBS 271.37]KIW83748.1 hypothetical protein Z517_02994 [Fonsecaea pedrosoi CBS 271.37]
MPLLPTHTSGSTVSASSDLATMTTLFGDNVTISSTPLASIPTRTPQPSITPPITNNAFAQSLRNLKHLWPMLMTFVAVTQFVSHE